MKSKLQKHLQLEAIVKAGLTMLVFVAVLGVIVNSATAYMESSTKRYYENSPIETFYTIGYFTVSDVCLGSQDQIWESDRQVHDTEIGWPAFIVRELFRQSDGFKVFDSAAEIFIEPRDEVSGRVQQIPPLKLGTYQWALGITLHLPSNIDRTIPLIYSNEFSVNEC